MNAMLNGGEDMDPTSTSNNANKNVSNMSDIDSSMEVFSGSGQQHAKRRIRASTDTAMASVKTTPRRGRLPSVPLRSPYHVQRKRALSTPCSPSSSSATILSKCTPLSCFICLITILILLWFLMASTIFYYPHNYLNGDKNIQHPLIEKMNNDHLHTRAKIAESAKSLWHQQLMAETQAKISLRTEERRARTLPKQKDYQSRYFQDNEFAFPDTQHGWMQFPVNDDNKEQTISSQPCGIHAQKSPSSNFLKRDELNPDSHILITGVLNPIGFHLVMALRERCGVENIYGIDPMFPNTVMHRLHYLQPKLTLLTADKWVWLPVPFVGLESKNSHIIANDHKKQTFIHEKTTQELHWLRSYPQITHIVHLATSQPAEEQYHYNHGNDPISGSGTSTMFSVRQSMTSMEQLLHSMVDLQEDNENRDSTPHMVYASSLPVGNEDKNMFTATKLMDEVLAKTYYNLHNIYSVGLRFSHVYGPWGNPGTEYYDLAEKAVQHWHDEGTINAPRDFEDYSMLFNLAADTRKKKKLVMEEQDFVFVDDAVNAIIAAMQFRSMSSIPAVFNIASGQTVAMKYIADIMESMMPILTSAKSRDFNQIGDSNDIAVDTSLEYLSWSSETSLQDGIRKLLSWHLDKHLPFGQSPYENNKYEETKIAAQETGNAFTNRLDQTSCDIHDSTCLRYKHVFPCSSECSENNVCTPSIFDSVRQLSLELSEDCDVVLYTASLGHNIDDLLLKTDIQRDEEIEENPDVPIVCNIAFIPKESTLVKLAVHSITQAAMDRIDIPSDNLTLEQKIDSLNGRLLHKGWMLIWIPNAIDDLSVDEKSLLKLSPSKMFHPTVKYAMFMDEFFSVSAHLDDVKFMVSEMKRKALSERSISLKLGGHKKKYHLPAEPERKCAILLSDLKLRKSDDKNEKDLKPGTKISTVNAAKYMLFEIGFDTSKSTPKLVKEQRKFYDLIPSYVNKQDLRSIFEPKYDFKLKHWVRTRWVVHDLNLEEARQLRCEWYQENVHWGNDLDQLSFAHVMAHREVERKIARKEPYVNESEDLDDEFVKQLTDKSEWFLLLHDGEESETDELYHPVPDNSLDHEDDRVDENSNEEESGNDYLELQDGEEVGIYARIMSDVVMSFSRAEWAKQQEKLLNKKKKKRNNKRGQEKKKVHSVNQHKN